MALPKKSVIFETLNQTRHWTDENAQATMLPELFPETPNLHAEYWLYSDLHNLFGEKYFPANSRTYIQQNLQMPFNNITKRGATKLVTPTSDFYRSHITTLTQKQNINPDAQLSRYACWSMSRNNPAMIFARTYFISPAIAQSTNYNILRDTSYQFARVHLREQLTQMEKILAGILNKHRVNFSQFNHNMTQAFFYGYGANDIKNAYRIPLRANDPLANYMGAASLHARTTALSNTINRFNALSCQHIDIFYSILYQELVQSRVNMLKSTGTAPEQDIFQTSTNKVATQLRNTEREFINRFATTKIK